MKNQIESKKIIARNLTLSLVIWWINFNSGCIASRICYRPYWGWKSTGILRITVMRISR